MLLIWLVFFLFQQKTFCGNITPFCKSVLSPQMLSAIMEEFLLFGSSVTVVNASCDLCRLQSVLLWCAIPAQKCQETGLKCVRLHGFCSYKGVLLIILEDPEKKSKCSSLCVALPMSWWPKRESLCVCGPLITDHHGRVVLVWVNNTYHIHRKSNLTLQCLLRPHHLGVMC